MLSSLKISFNGTSYNVADAICFQNFDFPVSGKNATLYGKGTYFSTTARYSHKYSELDSKDNYYIFVAQVLVGRYAVVGDVSDFAEILFLPSSSKSLP